MQAALTLCKPVQVDLPDRWDFQHRTHHEALAEIDRCAAILAAGTAILSGIYLRICDAIRQYELTDNEVRTILCRHFPPPRVSEFLKVAHAPPEVYRRYRLNLVGFRAVLRECRGYRIHGNQYLLQRKIRRCAERLIQLHGPGTVTVLEYAITIQRRTQEPHQ